jgi:hypothetical protein
VLQVGTPTTAAQARSVAWNRYDVDLNVQRNGSVQVTETQTIQFHGTCQQGLRLIPADRLTGIDNVSVGEDNGGASTRSCASDEQLPHHIDGSGTPGGVVVATHDRCFADVCPALHRARADPGV